MAEVGLLHPRKPASNLSEEPSLSESKRQPELWHAVVPVFTAAAIMFTGLLAFDEAVPVPLLLLIACVPPSMLAIALGHRWRDVEEGLIEGMAVSLKAVPILLIVATTIAAWAASGTIGAMISYGLTLLHPTWFLPATVIMCSIISLAIGSSWATAATIGVALMGIGGALQIPGPITAGAILGGAYFGDKMSPLSDTTNLAPGIAGANLFEHIHAMLYTTVPAFVVALLLFIGFGFAYASSGQSDPGAVDSLRATIEAGQNISLWMLAPVVLVIVLALKRVPALVVLAVATLSGVVMAVWFQGTPLGTVLIALYEGHVARTGNDAVDSLLSRGGISGMMYTVALVLTATAFGGIMERAGFIDVLLRTFLSRVRGEKGVVIATVISCLGLNNLLAEQYLAIVLPGRMFRDTYAQYGLHPRMLSRTLEDAGTTTSPLVPWNSCGAYMSATLGVATFEYFPFAFFNLLMPIIAIVYAVRGTAMFRLPQVVAAKDPRFSDG